MYFRDSFPQVRFSRSPQPKRIISNVNYKCLHLTILKFCWELPCCTSINFVQMSYLNMFRRKPASTRSDWHFTAFKDSSENYATFTRSIHYNLVLERSPSFGSNRSNLSITIFNLKYLNYSPVAFARAFNLATPINLLQFIPIFSYWIRLYLQLN